MKTVIDSAGAAFGPFNSVELDGEAAVLRCDSVVLPTAVLGVYQIVEDHEYPAPQPDPLQVQADAAVAIQALLDSTAQAHGYDSIISLCSYATSSVPRWAAEGQAGMVWRDACWSHALEIQVTVEAGQRAVPTTAEVLAEMPALVWPPLV